MHYIVRSVQFEFARINVVPSATVQALQDHETEIDGKPMLRLGRVLFLLKTGFWPSY